MEKQDTTRTLLDALTSISRDGECCTSIYDFPTHASILDARPHSMREFLDTTCKKYRTEGGCIMDVACGNGQDSAILISYGYKVVSCDLSERMVAYAQRIKKDMLVNTADERYRNWDIFQCDQRNVCEVVASRNDLPQTYDCILALGSALAYLLDMEDVISTLKGFNSLLRPGGALIISTRNFLPAITKGKFNLNGLIPTSPLPSNMVEKVDPYVIRKPGPVDQRPLAVFMDYKMKDGSNAYATMNPLLPETIKSAVKSAFGEHYSIQVLYDLKDESEVSPMEAHTIFCIVEKRLA